MAIPFYICWNWMDIGITYFYFLPEIYQEIPFFECVALFISVEILKGTLIPKLVSVSSSSGENYDTGEKDVTCEQYLESMKEEGL